MTRVERSGPQHATATPRECRYCSSLCRTWREQLLVDREANVLAKNGDGCSVLHSAAIGGNTRCIQLLLDLGVEIDSKDDRGRTAYDIAREWYHTEAANLLQKLRACNVTDHQNANLEADHLASDLPPMELDNEADASYQPRSNCCMRCQCDTCIEKENKVNNLEKENVDLKRKMAAMEERIKSIEERNSGFNGIPLVVTTMAGFDSGEMLGNGECI